MRSLFQSEQDVEQIAELMVIWDTDAIVLMRGLGLGSVIVS